MNKYVRFFIRLLCLFAVVEACSWAGLVYLRDVRRVYLGLDCRHILGVRQRKVIKAMLRGELQYFKISPTLGWSVQPNGKTEMYQANGQGIRSSRDVPFSLVPGPGRVRVCTFGDSFIHGDEVYNYETWQEIMTRGPSTLEVLNFGVPGYGLDQAFLRYQEEGAGFQPDFVVIGFTLDDMPRHVNTFRPFWTPSSQIPLSKPRFALRNGTLVLIPNLLRTPEDYVRLLKTPQSVLAALGEQDYYYRHAHCRDSRPSFFCVRLADLTLRLILNAKLKSMDASLASFWGADSEFSAITQEILKTFQREVLAQGAVPVVVIIPSRHDLRVFEEEHVHIYQPLHIFLRDNQLAYIDLMSHFVAKIPPGEIDTLYASQGHLSARGQKLVSEIVLDYFRRQGWLPE
ncbi:MAG TPA: SGNH/GDSL hydrolase family protein [Candidatus Omnitrophota bacterium]|nr:SGNH/GDSL hydrolase family protein [Candidatus Omnitrophota bacterium]HQO58192.1 SGNH/GDSL hydrolase family protein [Candidatus Omnitrophota bacterium]HQP11792.1 SGNH/GDSL hydrolase family protein [Candidatus Omnitrophota bacterium]